MKKFITLLPTALLLVACGNEKSTNVKDTIDSTINESKVLSQNIIVNVGEESNIPSSYDISNDPNCENVILKGLNFGISKNEYNRTEDKFLSQFEDEDVYGYHIGDFQFYNLTPYYYNNKLYRIDINGFSVLDYNDIIDQISVVKNIFSQKYGTPIFEKTAPKDRELNDNEGICIAEWKAGNKTIQLCFFDFTKARHNNLLKVVIFRSDIAKTISQEDKDKADAFSKANTDKI